MAISVRLGRLRLAGQQACCLTARIELGAPRYLTKEDRGRFCNNLLETVRQVPGIKSVSLIDNFPLYAIKYGSFEMEGHPTVAAGSLPVADDANLSSEFFSTVETELRQSRFFAPRDMEDDAEKVVIIKREFGT